MVLIIFGNGVDCQVVLGGNPKVNPSEKGVGSILLCWLLNGFLKGFFRVICQ